MQATGLRGISPAENDRALLQRRVALYSAAVGGVYLALWVYRFLTRITAGQLDAEDPSLWWHLAAAVGFSVPYVLLRGKPRSATFASNAEIFGVTAGVLATCVLGVYLPPEVRPDLIILLALTNVILGRSAFVPCTGQGTFVLVMITATALLICTYVGTREVDRVATVGAWWVLAGTIATATSAAIFGLRIRVRDAEQLGQYKLEEKLGEGGMGVVYRARHAFLRRPTAVKLLPAEKAGVDNLRRFEQEVQLTASLRHPNTVTIFDYGHTAEGIFYYAMEFIDGLDLSGLVARSGAQPPGRVVDLMSQAASALVEAHGIGLVHRDIKPSNIMVQLLHDQDDGGDFVKVLDFGLVKRIRNEGGIDLTNEANLSGTPQYMAPESIKDPATVDARADVYALGAVGYYLLTGTHVFGGTTIVEVCGQHLHSTPEAPSKRLGTPIDTELEQLLLACLEKNPADRPQSALELKQHLARCHVPNWTPAKAREWWAKQDTTRAKVDAVSEDVLTVDVRLDRLDAPMS